MDIEPLVASVATTQKLLDLSERAVYRLLETGELKSIVVGQGNRRVLVDSIRDYVRRKAAAVEPWDEEHARARAS